MTKLLKKRILIFGSGVIGSTYGGLMSGVIQPTTLGELNGETSLR